MTKQIYLLINLGTPSAPTPSSISRFLRQFLNDPLVINKPALLRWLLVSFLIVPQRAKRVAKAYESIWTDRGSPLRFHTEDLARALQAEVGDTAEVRWAMRYGEPSIKDVLTDTAPHMEIKILPLYPQYALSSTQSSLNELGFVVNKLQLKNKIKFLPYFYQYDEFISAYADVFRKYAPAHWDHVLFSFHGLPLSHLTQFCAPKADCCDRMSASHSLCYRAQSHHSARQIAHRLGLSKGQYSITFQSRLGREEWIKPYTDIWLKEAADRGLRNLVILCPSFVTDCLETLEEIKIRECENFKKRGGESLTLIPCLNSEVQWSQAIHSLLTKYDYEKDWVWLGKKLSPPFFSDANDPT